MASIKINLKKQKDTEYKGELFISNSSNTTFSNWFIRCLNPESGTTIDKCKDFKISKIENDIILTPDDKKLTTLKPYFEDKFKIQGQGKLPTNFIFEGNASSPDLPPTPTNPPDIIIPPLDPIDGSKILRLDVSNLEIIEITSSETPNQWNIIKVGHGSTSKNPELHSIIDFQNEKTLKINYPKGSFKPSRDPIGGIGFYSSPSSMFPESKFIKLIYDIYFDENFNAVKGGKLPGIFIGEPGASGGRHSNNQASVRMMWRTDDGDNINSEAYVYISDNQHSSYKDIPNLVENSTFGDSLWRGILKFKKHQWNRVIIYIKLNTFNGNNANKDGELIVSINDITCSFDKLVYTDQKVNIEGITTDTFFGGGDSSYATPNDTSVYLKNFVLIK